MKIGVELIRVLALYVFEEIVEIQEIGLFVPRRVIGLVDEHLFPPEIEGGHYDGNPGPKRHVIESRFPFGDPLARAFRREGKNEFVLAVENLDDRIDHVGAFAAIDGLSSQRPEDKAIGRLEQRMLANEVHVQLLGELDRYSQGKIPVGGMRPGDDDVFVQVMGKIIDDLPSEQTAQDKV